MKFVIEVFEKLHRDTGFQPVLAKCVLAGAVFEQNVGRASARLARQRRAEARPTFASLASRAVISRLILACSGVMSWFGHSNFGHSNFVIRISEMRGQPA